MLTLFQETATPQRRELYFFSLFRVLEAGALTLIAFAPLGQAVMDVREPLLLKGSAAIYLAVAAALLLYSGNKNYRLRRLGAIGMCFDIVAFAIALIISDDGESGIAMFMVFNVGASALILTRTASLGFAIVAVMALFAEYFYNRLFNDTAARSAAQAMMFAVTYIGTALICQQLRKRMSETEALADKRGEQLANLSELNELVLRRMRTGVLVVDGAHHIRLSNEAAWTLLGNPSPGRSDLAELAPHLHKSLWLWRQGRSEAPKSMTFVEGGAEVMLRMAALSVTDKLFLIFLEDSRIYSGRAEELTLATLGRLSASIAHEIRNPLAAINYSAQLLDESTVLKETDRRLLEIIRSQCQRMNGIVQNILGMARQERSQPESLELTAFTRRFVEEYRTNHPLETDVLQAVNGGHLLVAVIDPQHLHQILTILVHNALTYGREPGKSAQVTVAVRNDGPRDPPLIEVIDRGPGIPPVVVEKIFAPFYTTSEHGTGLGLYIAKQLCEANQSLLTYESVPGGGSCFRITLPAAQPLAPR